MSQLAIRTENLGKRYFLGENSNLFTITEYCSTWFKHFFLGGPHPTPPRKEFWALKELDLEVETGKILGILGQNGAGKSTLLKILSRITPPSTGCFQFNGKLASLLEVGTGFKHELTGRDNIYLSGTTLGLNKHEIDKRLDEIVAFAEIEKFIDTPIKRYSSGMYVRLAFAVAAHLEPDILLVDEVLAVGDYRFQKKCLERMGTVANEGRTVVFVSHNMQAISQFCNQGLLLEQGQKVTFGDIADVVEVYQERAQARNLNQSRLNYEPLSDSKAYIQQIHIDGPESPTCTFDVLDEIRFEIFYTVQESMEDLKPYFQLKTLDGQILISSHSIDWKNYQEKSNTRIHPHQKGEYKIKGWIPSPLLNQGHYELFFGLVTTHETIHDIKGPIQITLTDHHASFASCIEMTPSPNIVIPPVRWNDPEN